jgi:hypothetical protein
MKCGPQFPTDLDRMPAQGGEKRIAAYLSIQDKPIRGGLPVGIDGFRPSAALSILNAS